MGYFIGFDVGSSKTHALITNSSGICQGFGKSRGGNQQGVGYDGLIDVLVQSFEQASKMANINIKQIKGAGFGVSGYDFPSDHDPHQKAISTLGLDCPVDIVNDGVNGLLAGATRGIGVNVTAGSGVNCRGRGWDGREGRIVGNGTTFGEFGGGIEIALKGLHMVNYALMKRIPPTGLTEIYLEATGAKDELDLMQGLSYGRYQIQSSITLKIFDLARSGDSAAKEVLRFSGEELGWLAVSVIRQIGMENNEVEVIQSGSVFDGGELICNPMQKVILQHAPKARLIRLKCLPVVGSVILGMLKCGVDGYLVRQEIVQSLNRMVTEKKD